MGTDLETMYRGVSNAAWGYFLLHVNLTVNFNGGALNILPPFAGYLLLLSAIRKLSGERRELALLRPLGILLAAWNLGDWLAAWGGVNLEELAPVLGLLIRVAGLYFHVQFLTDMAALAEAYQPPESGLARRLLDRRTVYTVLCTVMSVFMYLPAGRFQEALTVVMIVLLIALAIVTIFIMAALFELRKLLQGAQARQPEA